MRICDTICIKFFSTELCFKGSGGLVILLDQVDDLFQSQISGFTVQEISLVQHVQQFVDLQSLILLSVLCRVCFLSKVVKRLFEWISLIIKHFLGNSVCLLVLQGFALVLDSQVGEVVLEQVIKLQGE